MNPLLLPILYGGVSAIQSAGLIGMSGLGLKSVYEVDESKVKQRKWELEDRAYYAKKQLLDRAYEDDQKTLDYQRDMFKIAIINTDNAASRANSAAMQANAQVFDVNMWEAQQNQILEDRQLYLESQILNSAATDTMLGENDTPETLAYILTELVKMYRDDTQIEPINGIDTEPDYSGFYTNSLGKNTYFKGDNDD